MADGIGIRRHCLPFFGHADNIRIVANALCSCGGNETCASCRFCQAHNTSEGRKALCENITRFLAFNQQAIAQAIQKLFPEIL
jgi:hypothetical protein